MTAPLQRLGFTRREGKTSVTSYYATRGRFARNCWTCDRKRCKCDPVTMRRVKRGARQQWREAIARELDDV